MYICLHCKKVFDETDMDERVIDRPCGEYGGYPKSVCPECGDPEITEAFECSRCGEWFSVEERHWHPYEEQELCEDCAFAVDHAIETSPYHDCDDVFSVLDAMIGV